MAIEAWLKEREYSVSGSRLLLQTQTPAAPPDLFANANSIQPVNTSLDKDSPQKRTPQIQQARSSILAPDGALPETPQVQT
jgi:hypothetical protein